MSTRWITRDDNIRPLSLDEIERIRAELVRGDERWRRWQAVKVIVALAVCAVGLGLVIGGCSTLGGAPVNWAGVGVTAAECAARELGDVIATVSRVLVGGAENWRKELDDLARTSGADYVACAVEQLRQDWTAPGTAAARDPRIQAGAARAQVFLAEKGVQR